jgi:hypothetical protein
MTRRIQVAASFAITIGVLMLTFRLLVIVIDWILGGDPLSWAAFLGAMAVCFVAVMLVDLMTDGRISDG